MRYCCTLAPRAKSGLDKCWIAPLKGSVNPRAENHDVLAVFFSSIFELLLLESERRGEGGVGERTESALRNGGEKNEKDRMAGSALKDTSIFATSLQRGRSRVSRETGTGIAAAPRLLFQT